MVDLTLDTTATVPANTSLTVVVEEDSDSDGTVENSVSQSVGDGANSYTLSGFAGAGQVRIRVEADNTDDVSTASLDSATVTAPDVAGSLWVTDSSGSVQTDSGVIQTT
jgi:hypothetical protein